MMSEENSATAETVSLVDSLRRRYEIKKRPDGVLCIYLRNYNTIIAEFARGAETDAMRFEELLGTQQEK